MKTPENHRKFAGLIGCDMNRLAVYKIGWATKISNFRFKIFFWPPKIGKIWVLRFFVPGKIPQKWAQNVKTPENDRKFAGLIICYMNRLAVYKIGLGDQNLKFSILKFFFDPQKSGKFGFCDFLTPQNPKTPLILWNRKYSILNF